MRLHSFLVFLGLTCAVSATVAKRAPSTEPAKLADDNIPGSYILEIDQDQDVDEVLAFISQVTSGKVTVKLAINSTLFKGVSVRLDEPLDPTNNDAKILGIRGLSKIRNVWPVRRISLSDFAPTLAPRGGRSGLGRRDTITNFTDTGYSTHLMGQVDKLHAMNITGRGIRIGIVDNGIDYKHPALGGCFGPGCLVTHGYDLIGDNFVDPGVDTPVPDDDPFDSCGMHGTHVAGIIAAQKNHLGFTGVAPDARLGMYRVFSCSMSTTLDIMMAGVYKAYEDGNDIIIASLGIYNGWSQDPWSIAVSRITQAGVPCVFAIGNSGGGGTFETSAPSTGEGVFAVGSFENTVLPEIDEATGRLTTGSWPEGGLVSVSSTWGPTFDLHMKPTVAAPGGSILSTVPQHSNQTGYSVQTGTSMAAPYVAGVIALIAQARGTNDPALLARLLTTTSKPGISYGYPGDPPDPSAPIIPSPGLAPVAHQGAGLVQAFDAAFVTTLFDRPALELNDTEHFIPQHTFTITNSGTVSAAYNISHVPALTFETLAGIKRKGLPVLRQEHATLVFDPSSLSLEAGQSAEIKVNVSPPQGLDPATLPIYSGWITVNGTSIISTSLPYIGAAGAMRSATVLTRTEGRNDTFAAGTIFQLPAPASHPEWTSPALQNDTTSVVLSTLVPQNIEIVMGSAETHLVVMPVEASLNGTAMTPEQNNFGFVSMGNIEDDWRQYPMMYQGANPGGWSSFWSGKLQDGSWAPPGQYRLVALSLRIFGDKTKTEDWDRVESPEFTIRYV